VIEGTHGLPSRKDDGLADLRLIYQSSVRGLTVGREVRDGEYWRSGSCKPRG
jgi:hypothetical protein